MIHHLPNGREVYLCSFAMRGVYDGVLVGSASAASQCFLENIQDRAADILPRAKPLVVVPPPRMPLPGRFCVAELRSRAGVRAPGPDDESFLYVCWFMDGTNQSLDAMIAAALPHLDWEANAENHDIMDF